MHRLSGLDAQFLAAEGGNSGSQYCALAIYQTGDDQPITAATMRQRLGDCISQCPPLRWKLVTVPFGLDRPVFVDTEVNLEDHVYETTVAAPADDTTLAAEAADILVVSYEQGLDVGIVGDAQTLPDAWDLIDDIRLELAELSALVTTERSSDR
jgi:hypothetical protein